MLALRQLVFDCASESDEVGEVEETLKWGEPSYLTKGGSTIRMDWKSKSPAQYAMYFNCNSNLVETFRELYRNRLSFQGNRAIIINLEEPVPVPELKHCITLALTYHKRKHLPLLGV